MSALFVSMYCSRLSTLRSTSVRSCFFEPGSTSDSLTRSRMRWSRSKAPFGSVALIRCASACSLVISRYSFWRSSCCWASTASSCDGWESAATGGAVPLVVQQNQLVLQLLACFGIKFPFVLPGITKQLEGRITIMAFQARAGRLV